MKILTMPQGSAEWALARLGIPTASQADKLLTPKKLEPSASAKKYMLTLLAEWLVGYPMENAGNGFTDRGTDMEAEARCAYELMQDVEVRQVGFLLRDDGKFGGSPDGLVGDEGGVEIKCPALTTMIGYHLNPATFADEYRGQCQALMYVSGRAWWDQFAYNPQLPAILHRHERDERYMAALDVAIAALWADMDAAREQLEPYRSDIARGPIPQPRDEAA